MHESERHDQTLSLEDCRHILDELESVIADAKALMTRFEATGFDESLPDDYLALHELYTRSVKEQQHYTQIMLAF
ncbi:hypothetical protein MHM84_02440 [Halomonas sp. McH1-25]|uniref:hypothetical protein n=1 Tax=unclassified Halomonas TaxID=2609666 RepID=UPI001EF6B5FC|nr:MULTISPECIES: hypothetical protein [unclassified Halomonas]MCG7598636.1 hypothetical protein [Halomonas sp. McH1-25]MCP1343619.1 hypothetical protein [Halomonas sp. FL8]MCP1363306.1 hypothetical protein [Halomonas sp. BBD45]MCP1366131.1 hypothetical protein [Halomonas sp. BBD48]